MVDTISKHDLLDQTADIVAAFVSKNPISQTDRPDLMGKVYNQLSQSADTSTPEPRPNPAVPIKKSVTDSHIICLEDGAKLKMLKRYLRTKYDMSPDEYRMRWGLPHDYPMVAPEHTRRRSAFAKEIGLGKHR